MGSPCFNARLVLPQRQPGTTGAPVDSHKGAVGFPKCLRGAGASETPVRGGLENALTALLERIPPAPANVNLIEWGQLTCKASPTI